MKTSVTFRRVTLFIGMIVSILALTLAFGSGVKDRPLPVIIKKISGN